MGGSVADSDLLARWRDGDAEAGNELVSRYFDLLHRFFSGRFDDGVPDLVQRTFLGAVQARDRLPSDVNFKAYLLGIAHRQLLMAYRSRRRYDAVFCSGDPTGPALVTSPSRVVARRERQRALLGALRELGIEHQVVVQLYYWEELPLDTIARIVDASTTAVKSRLHRARSLLRDAMAAHLAAPDPETSVRDFDAWARSVWRRAEAEADGDAN
jgi:RNA polymerase sigma-70 factor (ECF subfamily)